MISAARGAMAAARSRLAIARRMRRDSTSSRLSAISSVTAQATSASSSSVSGASGRSRSCSSPRRTTSRACVPCRATSERAHSPPMPAWVASCVTRASSSSRGAAPSSSRSAVRLAGAAAALGLQRHVDGVASHQPVGGVLAARHPHQAVVLAMDGVLAADARGVASGHAHQRAQARVGTDRVLAPQIHVQHVVDVLEDLVDLAGGGDRALGRAVVSLVGGAHDPGAASRG